MKPQKIREIVIEFERVQVVRRRARTRVMRCDGCLGEVDFIGLASAAELFGADSPALARFAAANDCHRRDEAGETLVCVASLLAKMKERRDGIRPELGDG